MKNPKSIVKSRNLLHSNPDKVKVGTILDKEVFRKLKERSAREHRPISSLIEDAVRKDENETTSDREMRLRSLESFLSHRFNLSKRDWDEIMEEDYYDQ